MKDGNLHDDAWTLLQCAAQVSKPLLWMHDDDSPQRLARKLKRPLKQALQTVAGLPDALAALKEKLCSIYRLALRKPLVGIGASPLAKRQGERTTEHGLLAALDFARDHRRSFEKRVKEVCSAGVPHWPELFELSEMFIDYLDWRAFVIENARGQAACLVLECVELLEAVDKSRKEDREKEIREETGDVFYNFMAFCLSLRIGAEHLALTRPSSRRRKPRASCIKFDIRKE